jgi:hypothetical protein
MGENPGKSLAIGSSFAIPLTGNVVSLVALKESCRGYYLWIALFCAIGATLAPLATAKGITHCFKDRGDVYRVNLATTRTSLGVILFGLCGLALVIVTIVLGTFSCMASNQSRHPIYYLKA